MFILLRLKFTVYAPKFKLKMGPKPIFARKANTFEFQKIFVPPSVR